MRITNESVRDACVVPDAAERFLSVFLHVCGDLSSRRRKLTDKKKKRGGEREKWRCAYTQIMKQPTRYLPCGNGCRNRVCSYANATMSAGVFFFLSHRRNRFSARLRRLRFFFTVAKDRSLSIHHRGISGQTRKREATCRVDFICSRRTPPFFSLSPFTP